MKHITSYRAAFDTYEIIAPRHAHLGNDNFMEAIGIGCIIVEMMVKGKTKRICIKDVLHMSKLQANLLSMSKLLSNRLKV